MRLREARPRCSGRGALGAASLLVLLLAAAQALLALSGRQAQEFGIQAGRWPPWPGLITAPLVHASTLHLISNLVPLFFLFAATIYLFGRLALLGLTTFWFAGGLLVWGLARPEIHLGASGLVYGLAAQLCVAGLLYRDRAALAIGLLLGIFYGGMLWGIFPRNDGISWESHLAGASLGAIVAAMQRLLSPPADDPGNEADETADAEQGFDASDPLDQYFDDLDSDDDSLEQEAEDNAGARR
ncbi:MAG: rhomboid family intramembrane serine protease [Leptospirales bacterium]|nr:rhomboid family intramembrane serine protease [Leptospirales bacterium]